MILYLFLLFIICWPDSITAQSISEKTPYPAFCKAAATDDALFSQFKRHPDYRVVLEHLSYEEGLLYFDFIKEHDPGLLALCNKWKRNDRIGNPIIYSYPGIGRVSPTTLRYLKVVSDLRHLFGDLSKLRIIEIGGGYGGQCKLLESLGGFASYTIVDLPQCLPLAKRYLEAQNVKGVTFISNEEISKVGEYDLVISNYAFSEIDRVEQRIHLECIIENAPMGYITYNSISDLFGLFSLTIEEVVEFLEECDKQVSVTEETPITQAHNQVLTWNKGTACCGI